MMVKNSSIAGKRSQKKKVVVVGWDGVPWELVDPLIESGELPFLKRLKEGGAHGKLQSTVPFLTPPAWTSMFTGVNPARHGIFDFFELEGYKRYPVLASDRRAPAIWQQASSAGKRACVIGVPITFPPDEINGVMVSGVGSPGPDSHFVYPSDQKSAVLEILDGEDLFIKEIPKLFNRDRGEFLKRVHEVSEKQKDLCLHFLNRERWDLFISVFMIFDWIAHFFWKDMDKSHPGYDPKESPKFKDAIKDSLAHLDKLTEEIYEKVKDDALFIVVADHGMGPVHKDIYINTLLKEKGYLFTATAPEESVPKNRWRDLGTRVIRLVDFLGLRHYLPARFRARVRKSAGLEKRKFMDCIDWGRTKAFSISSSGQAVRINLKDRYPRGTVSKDDYERVVSEIRELLGDLKDPDTGEKVIEKTYRADDVYHGPYLKEGPDILVQTKGEYILNADLSESVFGVPRHAGAQRSGEHREFGIFLAGGGESSGDIGKIETHDIAPSIYKALSLSNSPDFDGRAFDL